MDSSDVDELALRTHIRNLLLDYSLRHLTINYVIYTRSEVSKLLSKCLASVPVEDPTFLTLPVDPFEHLSRNFQLRDLQPYEQKWETGVESAAFIRDALFSGAAKPRTERCWEPDAPYFNPDRPMSPVLTRRAMRQTPKLGAGPDPHPICSMESYGPHFVEHVGLKSVRDEPILEEDISPRERDQMLGLRPKMDPETHQAITAILRHVPGAQPRSQNEATPHESSMLSAFLRERDTTPPRNTLLDTMPLSPPIFPIRARKTSPHGLKKLSDLETLGLLAKVEVEEDEDMSAANMLVVDGWNVIVPSQGSSDTPSLDDGTGSSSAQIDELFALTPPGHVSAEMFSNVKMGTGAPDPSERQASLGPYGKTYGEKSCYVFALADSHIGVLPPSI